MADASHGKAGRVGPFQLGKRYRHGGKDRNDVLGTELGRIYEANNVHTGAPAVVVMLGQSVGWEPEDSWQLHASVHSTPPFIALEVKKAPASGRMTTLADLLDLLTCAVERLERSEEARAHLTRAPLGRLKRWEQRWRRLPRARRRGFAVAALAVLGLGMAIWLNLPGRPRSPHDEQHAATAVAEEAGALTHAPSLARTDDPPPPVITYPLPAKPFGDQAKAPCKPRKGEVEINGGCWVELAKRPPCYDDQAEHQGKCYLPVAERRKPEPNSVQQ